MHFVVRAAPLDATGLLLVQGTEDSKTVWVFDDAPQQLPLIYEAEHHGPRVLAAQLANHDYLVLDRVLPSNVVTQLATYVRELHSSGGMQPGEQYSATELGHRGDKVCMKGSNSPECPALQRFVQAADQLYAAVSAHVPELSDAPAPHRSQPMLAVYPGQRARYPRHVDNPDGNGRILTCIVYLNATWRAGDGGELRLAPERSKAHLDIPPVLNRLVLFWSDARVPHEVLPAHAERAACTIWFIDAGRFHDFQRGSGRLKGSEGEPAAEGTRAASAQHAGSRAGSHPTTSPSPSNAPSHTPSHAGSPLIGALESRGMAMKTHLLGAESHAALRHSFVMRLRQLQLLVDAPTATVGWLPSDAGAGAAEGAGCSVVRGAESLLRSLTQQLPAGSSSELARLLARNETLEPRMMFIQHTEGCPPTTLTMSAEPVRLHGLALVYCLSIGAVGPSASARDNRVALQLDMDAEQPATSLAPSTALIPLAPDAVAVLTVRGRVRKLRLTGALTALLLVSK